MFTHFDLAQCIKRFGLFGVLLLTLSLVSGTTTVYGSTTITRRHVSPAGTDANNNCLTSSNPCQTINHALLVASPGDEIRAAAGTYAENIAIGKNITIEGESLGSTVIDGGAAGRVVGISPGVTATLSELNIQNGKLTAAQGAGLSNAGTLTLKHVIVTRNVAGGGATSNDNGGGIWNIGTLTVESSYVSGNHADNNGGGIYNQTGTLTLSNSVISSNSAGFYGGGIENQAAANLTHTNVANNSAQYGGGGVDDSSSSTLTLSDVTISGNTGTVRAGGMFHSSVNAASLTNVTFRNNSTPGLGGGLENFNNDMSLTDVTFESNSAGNQGGGMFEDAGAATLTNATFSDNRTSLQGSGLYVYHGATATLINNTFSGNWSGVDPGGAIANFGTVNLKNTILAYSPWGGNCYNSGTLIDSGYNLDSGISCGFSSSRHDLSSTDPLLGPLQNNGGYTDTLALLKGSPAINKGTNVGCPKTDQRGKTRVTSTDPTCDIGTYEYP